MPEVVDERIETTDEVDRIKVEQELESPDRAFGDLVAASGITDEMLDSLMALKDFSGIEGLPPLKDIEDWRYQKTTQKSARAEIERQKLEEIARARVRTEFDVYFPMLDQRAALLRPFTETKTLASGMSIVCEGWWTTGQVGAVRLGISRALQNWEPGLRPALRAVGLLDKGSRAVERKKLAKLRLERVLHGDSRLPLRPLFHFRSSKNKEWTSTRSSRKSEKETYGKVYKAKDKNSGQLVALKKTRLEMDEEGIPPTALREVSLLQMLSQSMYIVQLLCVEHVSKNDKPLLYLVFEYLDTDLKKFIDSHRKGSNPRPLPPALIRIFSSSCLRASITAIATAFFIGISNRRTSWAPEVLLGGTHYSTGVDMWSVGCIFGCWEHLRRRNGLDVLKLRDWHVYPQWEPQNWQGLYNTGTDGIDLLSAAMDHPYFDNLDKSQF
ncbi:unnamed protein product [Rhodiola kirilowii]